MLGGGPREAKRSNNNKHVQGKKEKQLLKKEKITRKNQGVEMHVNYDAKVFIITLNYYLLVLPKNSPKDRASVPTAEAAAAAAVAGAEAFL